MALPFSSWVAMFKLLKLSELHFLTEMTREARRRKEGRERGKKERRKEGRKGGKGRAINRMTPPTPGFVKTLR